MPRNPPSSPPAPTAAPAVPDPLRAAIREVVLEVLAERQKPGLVTIGEFAARHSLSPTTIRDAIRNGRLPATKVGRSVRIALDAAIGKPVRTTKPQTARDRVLAIAGGCQ